MRLLCPACTRPYDFPVELIRDEPFIAHCVTCTVAFLIGPTGVVAGRAEDEPRDEPAVARGSPAPRAIARVVLRRADVDDSESNEVPPETPPDADERDYLIVRGRATARPVVRRRVIFVAARAPDDDRPAHPARIVAHVAGFRRAVRAAEPAARSVEPALAVAQSTTLDPPVPSSPRRFWAATGAVVVAVLAAGGGGFAFRALTVSAAAAPEPPVESAPIAFPSVGAEDAAVVVLASPRRAVALDPEAERLSFEVLDVQAFPSAGAVAVFGSLLNGSARAFTALQLDVRLLADGAPARRRDVWCCDDIPAEHVAETALDFGHPHFQMRRAAASLETVRPGEARAFTAVFQGVDAKTLSRKLGAEIRVLAAP